MRDDYGVILLDAYLGYIVRGELTSSTLSVTMLLFRLSLATWLDSPSSFVRPVTLGDTILEVQYPIT